MTMMKVFICSPYRGNIDKNVSDARNHARMAAICGYCPVAPHLLFPQFLKDSNPEERILGITLGVELMKSCDEVWIFGSTISSGMAYELEKVRELGIPVRLYSNNGDRIYPETMMIDDRLTDAFRMAIRDLKFA